MFRLLCVVIVSVMLVSNVSAYAQTIKSVSDDRKEVSVTVYNSNIALVKDQRSIALPKGASELRFMDVATGIMPVTVHAKSLNHPDDFFVMEQNYEYDLMSHDKILDKYEGKQIDLVEFNEFQGKKNTQSATVLSAAAQIYQVDNDIYLGYPGYKVVREIPENLISKPTLMWMVNSKLDQQNHDLEVSYLTNNITWNADYVMVLGESDKTADLSGWVTIDNKSGATYKDAQLKLVAGDVNRAAPKMQPQMMYTRALAMEAAAPDQFGQKEFFEYHLYDLKRKTTIKDNQTKQISLMSAENFDVRQEYIVNSQQYYYTQQSGDQVMKQPVQVYIKFKNEQKNKLGMPLPEGTIRLYKKDSDGSLQFVGEDNISHTPKDEEVSVKVGNAFDVVCERVQLSYRVIADREHQSEWEVTLRNHKKTPVVVSLMEPLHGDWKVLKSTHPFKKVNAQTARFDIEVPVDAEVKVKYLASVRY